MPRWRSASPLIVSYSADGYGHRRHRRASVTVTTAAQLKQYAESATTYIITVSGTIDLGTSGRVNLKSNKTLKSANSSATIKGTINPSSVNNLIIQNFNVTANTGAAAGWTPPLL